MLVEFNHVSLHYGHQHPILDDVSFEVPAGSFHFLCGASGAGKSSLLRLLYLGMKPSQGTIKMFGLNTSTLARDALPPLRQKIGVVFQDFRLIPHLSVFENVALPLRLVDQNQKTLNHHVRELLNWVGVGHRIDAFPHQLSGGEQQRVAIARAVVNKPQLLLADEPMGNMDDDTAGKLLHLFLELNRMGTTIIFATHQMMLTAKLDKPVLQLINGKIISPSPQSQGLLL